MTALLEIRNASKIFGSGRLFNRNEGTTALRDFSLTIASEPPSITAVVGESGSGKTTLARLLLGIGSPTEGDVLYQGKSISSLNRSERLQFMRDVQVIFQDPYEVFNPFYKVDHVLQVPIRKFKLAKNGEEARKLMRDALSAVGLRPDETLGRHPHQLSGGQRQRIMVARALLIRPRLIIADEPVSMVDASLRATILESLRQLYEQFGISLLYITHDLTTAYQISQNIVVMYRGEVAEVGSVDLVVKQPAHPYTQLLINSIPVADPDQSWSESGIVGETQLATTALTGCRFADRCPHVMEKCMTAIPPLYQLGNDRAASCFLYDDKPILTGGIDQMMVRPSASIPMPAEAEVGVA
jgi:oligopeptide/dipeptide ABC transporter ATP-binding protein